MSVGITQEGVRGAFKEDVSLGIFLRKMQKFDQEFCSVMAAGDDFTLNLEVRGNKGRLIHARVFKSESEGNPEVQGGKKKRKR